MVVIRMRKMGSKKRPFFRVVVTDSRIARDSSFVEIVGHYNPRTKPAKVDINRERIDHWVGKGAQLSDTVRTLLKRHLTRARCGCSRRSGGGQDRVMSIRDAIETVAKALADSPQRVSVTETRAPGHDAHRGVRGAAGRRQADRPAGPHDTGDAHDRRRSPASGSARRSRSKCSTNAAKADKPRARSR